jgi:hypothetical protein
MSRLNSLEIDVNYETDTEVLSDPRQEAKYSYGGMNICQYMIIQTVKGDDYRSQLIKTSNF